MFILRSHLQNNLQSSSHKAAEKTPLFDDAIPEDEVRFVTPLNTSVAPPGKLEVAEESGGNNNDNYNPFSNYAVCEKKRTHCCILIIRYDLLLL